MKSEKENGRLKIKTGCIAICLKVYSYCKYKRNKKINTKFLLKGRNVKN
jgi:hypothetical protein